MKDFYKILSMSWYLVLLMKKFIVIYVDSCVEGGNAMPNPSPLRYPGGKARLANFIGIAIQNLGIPNCTNVEPFAGGAGVAIPSFFAVSQRSHL